MLYALWKLKWSHQHGKWWFRGTLGGFSRCICSTNLFSLIGTAVQMHEGRM